MLKLLMENIFTKAIFFLNKEFIILLLTLRYVIREKIGVNNSLLYLCM